MSSAAPWWKRSPAVWPLVGLALLFLINLGENPEFFKLSVQDGHCVGALVDIFKNGSYVMVLALGMTLVISTGGIDLSVGSVMAVAGGVGAMLLAGKEPNVAVAILAGLGAGLLCGIVNGALVAWARIQPIVATLVLMLAGRGLSQLVTHGNVVIFKNETFNFLGNGFLLGLPFAPILVTALYILATLWLRKTAAGLFFEAAGDNETASRFAGLATARIKCLAYAVCGLCAGVAGLIKISDVGSADPFKMGETMELDAIFAVVVGGTALTGGRISLLGSYVGALLLQTLTVTMYFLGVPPAVAPVPKALLIIGVCLLQSDYTRRWLGGLLPRRAAA